MGGWITCNFRFLADINKGCGYKENDFGWRMPALTAEEDELLMSDRRALITGSTVLIDGGDTFEIRTVTPYPDEYDECTEAAKQEQDEDARPGLAESVEGMEDYDIIFIGYPKVEQGF